MEKLSHYQLLVLLKNARKNIILGQYKHIKTSINYHVIGIALEEKTITPVVIYSDNNNVMWTRNVEDFKQSFELTKRCD